MRKKPRDAQAIAEAIDRCPTCRRPFLTTTHGLSPIRRRILDIVERHGEIMPQVLHAAIYGSDPNGGACMKTLHVHIYQLNKLLTPHGMALRSRRGGNKYGPAPYRLIAEAAE